MALGYVTIKSQEYIDNIAELERLRAINEDLLESAKAFREFVLTYNLGPVNNALIRIHETTKCLNSAIWKAESK
jgi:hypothetical protein